MKSLMASGATFKNSTLQSCNCWPITDIFIVMYLIASYVYYQVLSTSYIVLCTIALIFRHKCLSGSTVSTSGSDFFWNVVYRLYIQDDQCENSMLKDNLTQAHTVFVFASITLSASILTLIAAIALLTMVHNKNVWQYVNLVVYGYIGVCVISLVVDVTFATFFGMDYIYLKQELEGTPAGSEGNYETDVIRQGAFYLMTIALKGYIAHAVNLVLLILLIVYTCEYQTNLQIEEHSIHKLGVLNAFDQQRRPEDTWQHQPEIYPSFFTRGPQLNNGFIGDEDPPRSPMREPTRTDYQSNRSFNRSDSWHHSQPIPSQGARPFSYLEEIKRPVPVKPPASSAGSDPQWRRDAWSPAPPVPAPDYSPQTPRRLKSALKPAYM